MPDPLRVLIADDHPVFRAGLRALLETQDGFEVIGEAGTGIDAVRSARELQPDLVVMDLRMPELDGVEATRRIMHESPHIAVVVLTMFEDDDSVFAAMRAGARGYLLKGSPQTDVVRALALVGAGGALFGPAIAERVVEYFARPHPSGPALAFPNLTDREREVLELVAQGEANPRIALRLGISEKTVRNHVSNIFAKLAVVDRSQAIARAREAGLGGSDPARRDRT